jgi:hypothetical protein
MWKIKGMRTEIYEGLSPINPVLRRQPLRVVSVFLPHREKPDT